MTRFERVGNKGDAAAVGSPGDVAFGVGRSGRNRDFARERLAIDGCSENAGGARVRAIFVAEFLDPSDFFTIGRDRGLIEPAGGVERVG